MENQTIVFEDAYTGRERFGRIDQVFGDEAVVRIIGKQEAGPNPTRVVMKPDPRVASLTSGTGVVEQR